MVTVNVKKAKDGLFTQVATQDVSLAGRKTIDLNYVSAVEVQIVLEEPTTATDTEFQGVKLALTACLKKKGMSCILHMAYNN